MKNPAPPASRWQTHRSATARASWSGVFSRVSRACVSKARLALPVIAAAAVAVAPARAAASDGDEIKLLRQQIELLSKKIDALEKRQAMTGAGETGGPGPGKPAAATPAFPPGAKGLVVTSPDNALSVKLGALVQADARVFLNGNDSANDGFLMRRVRTPISGTVHKIFSFNITPEFCGSHAHKIFDAWAQAGLSPGFNLKIGKFKTPASLES
ncbi:MAG: OprO/OprP family phosphate-selective porin, partial [Opitutaceae bacterium]|nr:OprO/OprP family phosphate-selective porin [Opitutaceae bacterium]